MGVGGQLHAPATLPPGMTRYTLYRSLGRPQGRSGQVLKISLPPGFDPRTVQLVASRYTDWAIAAERTRKGHIGIHCKRRISASRVNGKAVYLHALTTHSHLAQRSSTCSRMKFTFTLPLPRAHPAFFLGRGVLNLRLYIICFWF
jgi:hypothetical protein